MLIEYIQEGIKEEEKEKRKSQSSPLRMSASGKCARQIGYQLYGFESEPLPPRSIMVFRLGDTIEAELKALLVKYLPPHIEVELLNEEISVDIDGVKILGHTDGIIKQPIQAVLEMKSINTMRYKSLSREGIPFDYQMQATAYMKALGLKKTLFMFYNKDTSHVMEIEMSFDESFWQQIVKRFQSVIHSTKENLPPREYHPDGLGKLTWHCSYCSYNKHCYPEAELMFDKQGRPSMWINKMKG